MKKFINKSLALLLAFCMLFCSLPFAGTVFAEESTETQTEGTTETQTQEFKEGYFTYEVNNKAAWITGYDSTLSGDVVIPDTLGGYPVTEIAMKAFLYCDTITSVTFNKSLEFIGYWSFCGCKNLTKITIPDNASTSILNEAFSDCEKLSQIEIPDDTYIVGGALENTAWYNTQPDGDIYSGECYYAYKGTMPANTSISIKEGTKWICDSAFFLCRGLTSITLPESLKTIGGGAFQCCSNLTSITFPKNVGYIGMAAFKECTGLTSVTIPVKVTSIYENTFADCTSLKSVKLHEGITTIEENAFINCSSLESIEIPVSNRTIGIFAFKNCTSLKSAKINGQVRYHGGAFYGCTSLTYVELGKNITELPWDTFFNCTSLKSITIPEYITTVDNHSLGYYWNTDESKVDKLADFTIYGYSCSDSERYATENGFNFVSIGIQHNVKKWTTTIEPTYKTVGEKQGICEFCKSLITKTINLTEYKDENTGASAICPDKSFSGYYTQETPTFKALQDEETWWAYQFKEYTDDISKIITYHFSFIYPNDLRSPIWIKMPIPTGFNSEKTVAYWFKDGKTEKMNYAVENGYIYFEVEELGWCYAIIDQTPTPQPEEPEDPTKDCTCNCHKTGIMKFFFKFMNFFQRIFKKNQLCKCGVAHY